MNMGLQYDVAKLFADRKARKHQALSFTNVASLIQAFLAIDQWVRLDRYGQAMVDFCIASVSKIHEQWNDNKKKKATSKAGKVAYLLASGSGTETTEEGRKRSSTTQGPQGARDR
jgi:hypothetical protein